MWTCMEFVESKLNKGCLFNVHRTHWKHPLAKKTFKAVLVLASGCGLTTHEDGLAVMDNEM